jgi:hypothetical protein
VIEPQQEPGQEEQAPNIAAIAIIGLMAGLVIWFGVACLVFGQGDSASSPSLAPGNISTPSQAARPTATRLVDRTNCAEIRGTDYRSDAERTWFLANCQ